MKNFIFLVFLVLGSGLHPSYGHNLLLKAMDEYLNHRIDAIQEVIEKEKTVEELLEEIDEYFNEKALEDLDFKQHLQVFEHLGADVKEYYLKNHLKDHYHVQNKNTQSDSEDEDEDSKVHFWGYSDDDLEDSSSDSDQSFHEKQEWENGQKRPSVWRRTDFLRNGLLFCDDDEKTISFQDLEQAEKSDDDQSHILKDFIPPRPKKPRNR
jgi:hypothetical protein